MKYVKHISMDEGVKGYDLRQYNYVSNFDGMDFDKAQYEISDDKDYHDAVDEDGWKSIFKIAKKYKSKLKKHGIKSEKDLENFAKWLSSGEHEKSESVNEMLDGEKLYKEIEKDRKTKMNSDIDDGSILFYHKDIAKGKAEVNVNGYNGDITIEVGSGPYGSGEWYGEPVKNMRDIDKQIKSYIKAEKSGEFEDMGESKSVNEEYIESMDSIEIANALGKIKTLWDTWKGGPMTEPSDVKPAQRELKGWMDRWFKQNIK